jgi:hypothetical protein
MGVLQRLSFKAYNEIASEFGTGISAIGLEDASAISQRLWYDSLFSLLVGSLHVGRIQRSMITRS